MIPQRECCRSSGSWLGRGWWPHLAGLANSIAKKMESTVGVSTHPFSSSMSCPSKWPRLSVSPSPSRPRSNATSYRKSSCPAPPMPPWKLSQHFAHNTTKAQSHLSQSICLYVYIPCPVVNSLRTGASLHLLCTSESLGQRPDLKIIKTNSNRDRKSVV